MFSLIAAMRVFSSVKVASSVMAFLSLPKASGRVRGSGSP
jgi:hypothetical protein